MAKDARGHGSDGGTGTFKTAGLKGVGIGANYHAAQDRMRSNQDFNSPAARTVFGLRQQMASTGPGHRAGLLQGIKNLLGG